MDSELATTNLAVSHRGTVYTIKTRLSDTLASFQSQLEDVTGVAPDGQKLLFKGKKPTKQAAQDVTLTELGLKDGVKVQMLGSTSEGASLLL